MPTESTTPQKTSRTISTHALIPCVTSTSSSSASRTVNYAGIFEPLITAEEAADHLLMHVKTVQKMAREGRVPCIRMGKYWRFRLSALNQWVSAYNQFQPAVPREVIGRNS